MDFGCRPRKRFRMFRRWHSAPPGCLASCSRDAAAAITGRGTAGASPVRTQRDRRRSTRERRIQVGNCESPDDHGRRWGVLGAVSEIGGCGALSSRLGSCQVRRIVLTLLALTVLLPSLAFGRGQYLCTVDHRVRGTCCCPPKHAKQSPTAPTIRAECCKQIEHEASLSQPADVAPPSLPSAPIRFTMVEPPRFYKLRTIVNAVPQRANAPPDQPSLYAQHCALLL